MSDLPIIFSGPMVCALLEGGKTMTRRLLKPQPEPFKIGEGWSPVSLLHVEGDPRPRITVGRVITKQEVRFAPGDRLWVRENFAVDVAEMPPIDVHGNPTCREVTFYAATDRRYDGRWSPSIHMPRYLSRLTLLVTAVKIERLYDISDDDIRAEGVTETDTSWLNAWRQLWESIHGPEHWDKNPFVVAISFQVERANIDSLAKVA